SGVVDVETRSRPAKSRHNLIVSIAIQVGARERMAVVETRINDAAFPELAALCLRSGLEVDHNLVAVPRLDSGQESPPANLSDPDFARATRRLRFLIARRQVRFGPAQVVAAPRSMKQVDALEACGQNFVPAIAVPVDDVDSMHDGQTAVDQVRVPTVPAPRASRSVRP